MALKPDGGLVETGIGPTDPRLRKAREPGSLKMLILSPFMKKGSKAETHDENSISGS